MLNQTRTSIRKMESGGKSVVSRRWKTDVKKIVNSYNFTYSECHVRGAKCDFCGNNLIYVAVIDGAKIVTDNSIPDTTKYSIGFDCLELTLGKNWTHYRAVKREITRLKKEAARQRRAEKYVKDYANIIDWLQKKNFRFGFYADMLEILTNGKRVFTKNMENSLRNSMERETKMAPKIDEYTQKFEVLLDMIVTLDKIDVNVEIPTGSAYSFVSDVARQFKERSFLSLKQKEALNKISKRYNDRSKKLTTSPKKNAKNTAIVISDIMKNIPY